MPVFLAVEKNKSLVGGDRFPSLRFRNRLDTFSVLVTVGGSV